jgi:uncharacterized protein
MEMSAPVSAGLWTVFLLGLTGGFGHCLAMCGPLVSAASLAQGCGGNAAARAGHADKTGGALRFQVLYHAGRLATYVVIGALLGLLGQASALVSLSRTFSPDQVTRWLKVGAGVSLIVVGVVLLVSALGGRVARVFEPTRLLTERPWFTRATNWLVGRRAAWGFALGALMGLLPCMPLLPVELAALSTGYPLGGALTMLAFGIGTVPALAGFGAAAGLLGSRARGGFATATGVIVVVLGVIVAWQGFGFAATL